MAFNPHNPDPGRARIADIIAVNITGTSYTDTSAPSGGEFGYYVASVGASGGSTRTPVVWGGVNVRPPAPAISTVALDGSVRLSIQDAAPTQTLRVLSATTSGGPYTTVASNLAANTTLYTVTGLTDGTPAYFAVEAVNSFGFNRSLEAYAIPHVALATPGGLAASAENGAVALSWSAVPNARAYRVARSLSSGTTPTDTVIAETTLASVADLNVPNNVAYKYYVTALGDAELASGTATLNASAHGKILFVHAATASPGDLVLRDRMTALGFDVTEKSDAQLASSDAAGQDVVVVSETVTSGNVNTKLTNVAVPVLDMEPSLLDDLRMTSASTSDYGTTGNQTQINLVDSTHPLSAFLSGVRTINTTGGTYLRGNPGGDVSVVGRLVSSGAPAGIFGYELGVQMASMPAPARRVGLFVDSITATSFTNEGKAIFDAAVSWDGRPSLSSP